MYCATGPNATQLTKLLVTTPCPKTTPEMLIAGGHILRIPDNTKFTTFEHKQLLLALSDTWDASADHQHIVGSQGLCYTISRDYFGYGR